MPKDPSIKKVLVIGSGPIIIGQAAEFDYSGTQACRALKSEGIEVVLVNSNPATIMTDPDIADRVYVEPMTLTVLRRIIEKEKPDSILPNLGGQTGLNLAMELARSGYLEQAGVRLLGAKPDTIDRAEDRQLFKDTMEKLGEVREDIVRLLGLADPVTVVTGFDRPNLYFGVEEPRDKYAAVTRYLAAHTGASGIVYCLTRKTVEEVCEKLRADGYAATRYHAGLSADERQRNQDAFLYDEARVMVATNAFGMGIDKSNVSFVLHYNMPKNIESYYQEAGRAGRDGQPADCILLYGGKDVVTNRFFIEKDDENDALDEETRRLVREKDEERLRRMTFYCHSGSCLRAYLLRYFGENAPEHCDNCSVCSTQTEKVDVSGEARIIFLFLRDLRYPLGAATVIDALRGSESERVLRHRLERADGYGRLRSVSAARLRAIFNHLTAAGYLEQAAGQYPTLSLGAPALEFLEYGGTVTLRVAKEAPRAHESTAALPADMALFERLKELRLKFAKRAGVPAFVIFTDATLRAMSAQKPRTMAEFLKVPGVGGKKADAYGKAFLERIGEES